MGKIVTEKALKLEVNGTPQFTASAGMPDDDGDALEEVGASFAVVYAG